MQALKPQVYRVSFSFSFVFAHPMEANCIQGVQIADLILQAKASQKLGRARQKVSKSLNLCYMAASFADIGQLGLRIAKGDI